MAVTLSILNQFSKLADSSVNLQCSDN